MKRFLLLFGLFAIVLPQSLTAKRGDLLEKELLAEYSIQEAKQIIFALTPTELDPFLLNLLIQIDYPMTAYRVTYETARYDGSHTTATGLVVIPQNSGCALPIAAYCHGTIFDREAVPSNQVGAEYAVGLGFAGAGYLTVLPDYIGLGGGNPDDFHPFVEEETEANATIDLIRATRQLAVDFQLPLSGEVFLSGYSQGGHAGMATLRSMQEDFPREFYVPFAGLGSGPYDLSGIQFNYVFNNDVYPNPEFSLYSLASCQFTFEDQYSTPGDVLNSEYVSPYVTEILGQTGDVSWIPQPWKQIFREDYLNSLITNPYHPLRACLRKSNVYDWLNLIPTTMFYCTQDEQVDPQNAFRAKIEQRKNIPWYLFWLRYRINTFFAGDFNHVECAFPTLLITRTLFNTYRSNCVQNLVQAEERASQTGIVFPHSLYYDAELEFFSLAPELEYIDLITLQGEQLRHWSGSDLRPGKLTITRQDLKAGNYGLVVKQKDGNTIRHLLFVRDPEPIVSNLYDPISPNPVEEGAVVDLSLLEEPVQMVSVYDERGNLYQRHITQAEERNVRLSRNDLPGGSYLVEVRTSQNSYFLPLEVRPGSKEQLRTFPNPMRESTNLDLRNVGEPVQSIRLFDSAGRLVRSYGPFTAGRDWLTIDRGQLSSGIYSLEVRTTGSVQVLKLTVL